MAHHRYPHRSLPKVDLSDREREVLRHVAQGMTNKRIANVLGIGERTVDRHLDNVYQRLGVRNRLAVVVRAGIVEVRT